MIKESVQQGHVCALYSRAPGYFKQMLKDLMEDANSNTMIRGDTNTLLLSMGSLTRQKSNKSTTELIYTVGQKSVIHLHRTVQPRATEYTFFSLLHGNFSRTDHMQGHKTSLSKLKEIEIMPCFFSNHNGMKLLIDIYVL